MAYIGTSPSQGVRHRYLFTATSGQTTFTGSDDDSRTLSYTDTKFMDVFLNGVLLDPNSDYTATTGSSVVLTSGASAGDLLEVIAFDTFSVFSGTFGGDVTVGGALDATTATFDRAGTDGTIIDLQKDGSTVGIIGSYGAGGMYIGSDDVELAFRGDLDSIYPVNNLSGRDNSIDLGLSGARFKDLYLSGGVYLGGTGSANYLDDYEEGTWTPVFRGMTFNTQDGHYVKIGKLVHCTAIIAGCNSGTPSAADANLDTLPFTVADNLAGTSVEGSGYAQYFGVIGIAASAIHFFPMQGTTACTVYYVPSTGVSAGTTIPAINRTNFSSASLTMRINITYLTT